MHFLFGDDYKNYYNLSRDEISYTSLEKKQYS